MPALFAKIVAPKIIRATMPLKISNSKFQIKIYNEFYSYINLNSYVFTRIVAGFLAKIVVPSKLPSASDIYFQTQN